MCIPTLAASSFTLLVSSIIRKDSISAMPSTKARSASLSPSFHYVPFMSPLAVFFKIQSIINKFAQLSKVKFFGIQQ